MAQNETDKRKNAQLRRLHALLRKAGIDNGTKREMIGAYGVESSKEMTEYEIADLCRRIEMGISEKEMETDRWRKRLMGAIGGWLRATGRRDNAAVIKAIACRAAGKEVFGQIPKDRLISLYNAFRQRTKDLEMLN